MKRETINFLQQCSFAELSEASFDDAIGLDEALEELWNCY